MKNLISIVRLSNNSHFFNSIEGKEQIIFDVLFPLIKNEQIIFDVLSRKS